VKITGDVQGIKWYDLDKLFAEWVSSITSKIRRQHHEQRPGQQEDLQKGTGKNPERKKGRKKDQKGRKEEITATCSVHSVLFPSGHLLSV
jgi:hypothetical protein